MAGAILAGTVTYLVYRPHDLGASDESVLLYESKRILDGDRFYRDIFEIFTPGAQYLFALGFALFGTTMNTARAVMAFVHGVTAMAVFGACRTIGCPRMLGLAAAGAYVAVCQPAWPYASQHWVSTMLLIVLLLVALRQRWMRRTWGAALAGLLVGLMILVQQHQGAVFAPAMALLFVLDRVLRRGDVPSDGLVVVLGGYVTGALAVAVPSFAILLRAAGVGPVWQALVEHPLSKYRELNRPLPWGWIGPFNRPLVPYTWPSLLKFLPAVLVVDIARAAAAAWSGWPRSSEAWELGVLILFGAASIVSVLYNSDFIHIAFIAPVFLIALAGILEWGRRRLSAAWQPLAVVVPIVVLGLLGGIALHLYRNQVRGYAEFPVAFESPFGRIDVPTREQAESYARIRSLVDETPTREMFCYPVWPALYLITGARNPTPYQFLHAQYNFPEQLQNTIDILDRRKVPLVVIVEPFLSPGGPVADYLHAHYEPVDGVRGLYRRKVRDGVED